MNEHLDFLTRGFFERLQSVPADSSPLWGKMNLRQMVEHLSDSVRYANGGDPQTEIVTPADRLPSVRDFLYSEKEFRPNTRNSKMGEEPAPVRHADLSAAVDELKAEVEKYVRRFDGRPGHTERSPFFGDLDFDGWNRLFVKHFHHHLRQFGAA
ncbi:MAG: hypothetical protein RL213_256 [Bacteroidota bacterium]|jgi:hypothetical protein